MPLPVLPGVLRIAITGQIAGGGTWANVWHARNDSLVDFNQASIEAFDDIFWQLYGGPPIGAGIAVRQCCRVGTTFQLASYTPLDGSSGAFVIDHATSGSETDDAMPAEVAEVVTLRSALRGRQNRGRIYLPAMTKAHFLVDGHIDPVTVSGILTQVRGVETALETAGSHLGVASYGPYKNPTTHVVSADPLVNGGSSPHFSPVAAFTMDDMADVMRGRKT